MCTGSDEPNPRRQRIFGMAPRAPLERETRWGIRKRLEEKVAFSLGGRFLMFSMVLRCFELVPVDSGRV